MRYGSNGPNKACIWIKYKQYHLSALLDTGSDVTIAGEKVAEKMGWQIVEHRIKQVRVANNEPMCITGAVYADLTVGDQNVASEILITPDLTSLVLGIDWLQQRDCLEWDLAHDRVRICPTRWIVTHSEAQIVRTRRIILTEETVIPPRGQATVTARMPHNRWHCEEEHEGFGVLESETPLPHLPHLYIARTIVPMQTSEFEILVLNARTREERLSRGTCLGKVHEAEPIQSPAINRINQEETENDVVEQMMSNLQDALTMEQQDKVRKLLDEHRTILSINDHDIGRTHLVQHTIDTGDRQPIRQPLRRQPFQHQEYIDEETDCMLNMGSSNPRQVHGHPMSSWSRKRTVRFASASTIDNSIPLPLKTVTHYHSSTTV